MKLINIQAMKKLFIITALLAMSLGAAAQEAVYTVKSGKITMEAGMGGMRFGGMGGPGMGRPGGPDGMAQRGPGGAGRGERGGEPRQFPNPVIYFDDYGAKQVTVTEFNGNTTRTLVIDGKNVMVNDAEKTAREMPQMGAMSNRTQINFSALTDKVIKKNKIKELGEEEVAGKLCKKYSYRTAGMNGPVTQFVWIYKGITLKSAMDMGFGEMGQTALSIEEDIEVDPALFTLPEGVKVEKMQMPQMGGFGGPGGPGGFGGGGFGGGMDDGFGGF